MADWLTDFFLVVWLRSKHVALLSVSQENILSDQEGNNTSLPSKDNLHSSYPKLALSHQKYQEPLTD